jgi:hypothetical protein
MSDPYVSQTVRIKDGVTIVKGQAVKIVAQAVTGRAIADEHDDKTEDLMHGIALMGGIGDDDNPVEIPVAVSGVAPGRIGDTLTPGTDYHLMVDASGYFVPWVSGGGANYKAGKYKPDGYTLEVDAGYVPVQIV